MGGQASLRACEKQGRRDHLVEERIDNALKEGRRAVKTTDPLYNGRSSLRQGGKHLGNAYCSGCSLKLQRLKRII